MVEGPTGGEDVLFSAPNPSDIWRERGFLFSLMRLVNIGFNIIF